MSNAITILHISDMQFGKLHRFAEKNGKPPNPHDTLLARLIDDLEHLATHNQLKPDLIICTGDLAEWGLPKEFTDAFAFLAKLCEHYSLCRSRCIAIPGNHDISRFGCSAYFDECKANGEEPVFPWFPKWKQYKAAFDTFYAGFPDIRFKEGEPWSLFINEELRVVVAGLNSTMDEGHDAAVNAEARNEKGHHGVCEEVQYDWFKRRLGEPQFQSFLRIGAVHHNAIRGCRSDDENLRDADLLGGILGDHLHLLLHGHTHEAKADMLAAKLRVYSTGSASLKTTGETPPVPTDIPNQYQFLRVDRTGITRYCRAYAPRNTPPVFIADVRQSASRSDWIIKDSIDFRNLSSFKGEDETQSTREETGAGPQSTGILPIPKPPAFYAKPDYIGLQKFVGRDAELENLSDWARPADPTNLLLFEAIGGNGKSMLTWEWTTNPKHAMAARPANEPWAGRFWYSFYERGAIMADFCQHALAYMTGHPLEELRKKKTAELREPLLAQLHAKPWLFILDGLERVLVAYHRIDAAEVPDEEANIPSDKIVNRNPCDTIRDEDNDLLLALAAVAPSKILVSSRLTPRILLSPSGQPITGVKRITLPGLRPPDAEKLLRSCGIKGQSTAIQAYLTANCDNHPLVIGVLGGLIKNYLPDRGNFDSWAADPDYGYKLDLASLGLIQRRNHILRAAIDASPPTSRQLLSTLALLSESVDYETLKALNPHLPPGPEEVMKPELAEERLDWEELSDEERRRAREEYEAALASWRNYEKAAQARLASMEYREASKQLAETVRDLEVRGLLQYDAQTNRFDLHPVVRGVASGWILATDKERYGKCIVDYFASLPHSPWGDATTLEDLRPGLHVVRTLLKLGHFQKAADAYVEKLCNPLLYNLDAFAELLSIERPFFKQGWGALPDSVLEDQAIHLASDAGNALEETGQYKEALLAYGAVITRRAKRQDWTKIPSVLGGGIGTVLSSQHRLAKLDQIVLLALEIAMLTEDEEALFDARSNRFVQLKILGRYAEAQSIWEDLSNQWRFSLNQRWAVAIESEIVDMQFERGQLKEDHLKKMEALAEEGKYRATIRGLHRLRGNWRMQQHEWKLAAESFGEALRMAREVGQPADAVEAEIALAKLHLGQETDARSAAERISNREDPPALPLAELWQALGKPQQAKHHALAAYKSAWADGEPYVYRYELAKTTELLNTLGVPTPTLPPYDPAKDEPFSWEADIRAAIPELKAQKEAKEKAKQKDPD